MKRIILYIFLILVSLSCNEIDRPKKPENLISKDKMVDVITDIAIMNAAKGTNKKIIESNSINPENYIFNKYKIDSIQFVESNNYYAYDVKEYEDIYLKAKQSLQKKNKEYKVLLDEERMKKDSLRKFRKRTNDSLRKANKKNIDSLKKSKFIKKSNPSDPPGNIGKPIQ